MSGKGKGVEEVLPLTGEKLMYNAGTELAHLHLVTVVEEGEEIAAEVEPVWEEPGEEHQHPFIGPDGTELWWTNKTVNTWTHRHTYQA